MRRHPSKHSPHEASPPSPPGSGRAERRAGTDRARDYPRELGVTEALRVSDPEDGRAARAHQTPGPREDRRVLFARFYPDPDPDPDPGNRNRNRNRNRNYENIRAVIDAGIDMQQGVAVNDPALSKKDEADLRWGKRFPCPERPVLVERVSAGAASAGVRVVNRKTLLLDGVDEVDGGAIQVVNTHFVDHHLDTAEVNGRVSVE